MTLRILQTDHKSYSNFREHIWPIKAASSDTPPISLSSANLKRPKRHQHVFPWHHYHSLVTRGPTAFQHSTIRADMWIKRLSSETEHTWRPGNNPDPKQQLHTVTDMASKPPLSAPHRYNHTLPTALFKTFLSFYMNSQSELQPIKSKTLNKWEEGMCGHTGELGETFLWVRGTHLAGGPRDPWV